MTTDSKPQQEKSPIRIAIDKLNKVGAIINQRVFERENETEGILLALLTGTSCLFLGAPGAAKTHQIRVASNLLNLTVFDTLISETTKPDSIFGPPDIPALAEGIQRNKIKGYAPDSEILFFDEIFKASGIVLNPLLWLVNEHEYRNGDEGVVKCPTLAVFAASNEIPTEEGLKPIYDRFLLRYQVKYIRSTENLNRMINVEAAELPEVNLTKKDLLMLRDLVKTVEVSTDLREVMFSIRDQLTRATGVIISDRRLVKAFRIVQAHALLRGRKKVLSSDLAVLANVFWDTYEQIGKTRAIVLNAANAKVSDIMSYETLAQEIWEKALKDGELDQATDRLKEMHAAVAKATSTLGQQVAKVIDDYITRIQVIQAKRTDFVIMEMRDAKNELWYKLSASCESLWSEKQLRSVRFRWSRKFGYWWRKGPNQGSSKSVFRENWKKRIKRKLEVDAQFSKMI